MSENCINKTVGRLSVRHYLSVYPHNAAVNNNMHKSLPNFQPQSDTTLQASIFFKEPQYYATYPQPWYPPSNVDWSELNGLDPSLCLVNEKSQWESNMRSLLKNCTRKSNLIGIDESSLDHASKLDIPLNVALLAEHLEKDPDDQFRGAYNWYYGSGNVDCIHTDNIKYIIKPSGLEDGILYITPLELINNHWTPLFKNSYEIKTEEPGPIYQVHTSNANFLVRQKQACSLFRLGDEEQVTVERCNSVKRQYPFVCCAPSDGNTFATLTTNRELSIWNPSSKWPLSNVMVPLDEEYHGFDNWGSVLYSDSNTILYADRTSVNVIDSRVHLDEIQGRWKIGGQSETCEQVCGMASGSRGLQYVVTTHQIFGLDLRKGFTQRWTHTIPNSPSFVKVLKQRNLVDKIFIGSLHSDTVVMIENRWDEGSCCLSRIHPLTLPSMRESLHAARCQGQCLSHTVAGRFNMSITGLCCFEDEDINIIRCSSVGDIFIQKVIKNNSHIPSREFNSEECELLNVWEQKCKLLLKKKKKKVAVSDVKHVTYILEKIRVSNEEPLPFCRSIFNFLKPSWHISKSQLLKYCDNLAPKLLEIWNLENEEEWDTGDSNQFGESKHEEVLSDEDDFVEKVTSWIKTYASEMNLPGGNEDGIDLEDDPDDFEAVSSDDSDNILEEKVEEQVKSFTQPESPQVFEETQPKFQPQAKKGKRSYVSGF